MKTINKPVHQGNNKGEDKSKIIDFSTMDMGKLGVGLVGLGMCGQYLYPSIFSVSNLAMGGVILSTGGAILVGGVVGAVATSTLISIMCKDKSEEKEVKELEK